MATTEKLVDVSVELLRPYERNAKKHNEEQIEKLKNSIKEFGFLTPCLVDKDYNLIAGHGRVIAAKELGLKTVPCVFIEGLTEEQRRAYILVDNKIGELAGWDFELLESELADIDLEMGSFGFKDYDFDDSTLDDLFEEVEPKDKEPKTIKCPHCGEIIEL